MQQVADYCSENGVTRQAVHAWIYSRRIPPRALANLVTFLELSAEDIEQICPSELRRKTPADWARKYAKLKKQVERLHEQLLALEKEG